jgi:hypothetical protein
MLIDKFHVFLCLFSPHCFPVPLDFASKDVKNSSLLFDMLKEQDNMTKTLEKMEENRDENTNLLFFSEHGSQIVSMMDLQVEIL